MASAASYRDLIDQARNSIRELRAERNPAMAWEKLTAVWRGLGDDERVEFWLDQFVAAPADRRTGAGAGGDESRSALLLFEAAPQAGAGSERHAWLSMFCIATRAE